MVLKVYSMVFIVSIAKGILIELYSSFIYRNSMVIKNSLISNKDNLRIQFKFLEFRIHHLNLVRIMVNKY